MRLSIFACVLAIPVILVGTASARADNQKPQYLLNCRLMDHVDPLYRRYCLGDTGATVLLNCASPEECRRKLLSSFGAIGSKSGDGPNLTRRTITASSNNGGGTVPGDGTNPPNQGPERPTPGTPSTEVSAGAAVVK